VHFFRIVNVGVSRSQNNVIIRDADGEGVVSGVVCDAACEVFEDDAREFVSEVHVLANVVGGQDVWVTLECTSHADLNSQAQSGLLSRASCLADISLGANNQLIFTPTAKIFHPEKDIISHRST
jgi:hypothetical protein